MDAPHSVPGLGEAMVASKESQLRELAADAAATDPDKKFKPTGKHVKFADWLRANGDSRHLIIDNLSRHPHYSVKVVAALRHNRNDPNTHSYRMVYHPHNDAYAFDWGVPNGDGTYLKFSSVLNKDDARKVLEHIPEEGGEGVIGKRSDFAKIIDESVPQAEYRRPTPSAPKAAEAKQPDDEAVPDVPPEKIERTKSLLRMLRAHQQLDKFLNAPPKPRD